MSNLHWPGHHEYNAALQHPERCFGDAELSGARPHCDALGSPVPYLGASAVVYQMRGQARPLALRCFTTPAELGARYSLLSRYLAQPRSAALIEHEYVAQGIRVGEQWYPVVKMRWVDGRPLHHYVEQHRHERPTLRRLADKWRALLAELGEQRIAHGDLHHDNVLIDHEGNLRLLDYDAMFVPLLHGADPGERGHLHFQHPQRLDHGYYGENADAFAGLVIYLSLLAVAIDPTLWAFHTGENLIFTEHDYRHPGATELWRRVKASQSRDVRQLAGTLEAWCRATDLAQLPSLETVLRPQTLPHVAARRKAAVAPPRVGPLGGAPRALLAAPRGH